VSKLEFFVALALVALAQTGKGEFSRTVRMNNLFILSSDISIEHVAALAEQNDLPAPSLDLSSLPPSFSDLSIPGQGAGSAMNVPPPFYSNDDPWSTATQPTPAPRPLNGMDFGGGFGETPRTNGASSSALGTGLPAGWWRNLETVTVNVKGQEGFILNRYTVYDVTSVVSANSFIEVRYLTLKV
jgi:sorting nexin-8